MSCIGARKGFAEDVAGYAMRASDGHPLSGLSIRACDATAGRFAGSAITADGSYRETG